MRKLVFVPLIATLLAFGAPSAALAASTAPQAPTSSAQAGGSLIVPIVTVVNGVTYNAAATITNVSVVNGVLTATGTITGTVATVVDGVVTLVTIPITNPVPFSAPLIVSGTCRILTLDVGAIHLDLLGLVVNTLPIHVTIDANAAPGNLLGNLLCAVAHLLDNPSAPLSGIAALLNRILGILGTL